MARYKSLKPLLLGNHEFNPGQEIPEEYINPDRVKALLNYKLIAPVDSPKGPVKKTAGLKKETEIIKTVSTEKLKKLSKDELSKIAGKKGIKTEGKSKEELINGIKSGN